MTNRNTFGLRNKELRGECIWNSNLGNQILHASMHINLKMIKCTWLSFGCWWVLWKNINR